MSIGDFADQFLGAVWDSRFLWLPAVAFMAWWKIRLFYLQSLFVRNIKWVLLEVKIPRDIAKSPHAFEIIFNGLNVFRNGNLIDRYWNGRIQPWHSLEIASHAGHVHFYINTWEEYRQLVENQIYAQYPDVEIVEADDYTRSPEIGDPTHGNWGYFGTEYVLAREDAYPIKTYVDYELNASSVDEEQKNDPITAHIEIMGSLKDGEEMWYQILIKRAQPSSLKEQVKNVLDDMLNRKKNTSETPLGALRLSPGETDVAKAVERKASKVLYHTSMRSIYLAKREVYNPTNIPAMIGVVNQYAALNLNGFKPVNITARNYFFVKRRESSIKRRLLDAYRHRSAFYMPHERKTFIMNTEELATIYHFPGRVSETPTLRRIETKKSEPPLDLPT